MTMTTDMARAGGHTVAEDLADVSDYFGIAPCGADMIRLTGLSNASLSRLKNGVQGRLRPNAAAHIAVLGQFVREARAAIERHVPNLEFGPQNMRAWLHTGGILHNGQSLHPIDALSEPSIAVAALNQLREDAGA